MNKANLATAGHWSVFSAVPHRMMFFGGAVQLVLPVLFWTVELLGRYTGLWSPLSTTIPMTWVHGFLMVYGVFTFFIFGFLMTTYTRWMGCAELTADRYAPVFVAMSSGILLFYVGLFVAKELAALGIALLLAGWARAIYVLLRVYLSTPFAPKKLHETVFNGALTAGWLGAAAYLVWLLSDNFGFLAFSRNAGLWLFLTPVFFCVCHRMIPFFSASVLKDYQPFRPMWSVPLLVVCVVGHFALEMAGARAWLWLFDAPLAGMGIYLSARWQLHRSLGIRLLAVLHIGFAWFGVALSLYTVQSLVLLATGDAVLGYAPLHALGIGYFACMMLAMATRVTLGHSGRELLADRYTWICFLGLNAVAVLRIAAALASPSGGWGGDLNVVAALCWLVFVGAWVVRYAPVYLVPRVDGKPG